MRAFAIVFLLIQMFAARSPYALESQTEDQFALFSEPDLDLPEDASLCGPRPPMKAALNRSHSSKWVIPVALAVLAGFSAALITFNRRTRGRSFPAKDDVKTPLAQRLAVSRDYSSACEAVWRELLQFAVNRLHAPTGSTPQELMRLCDRSAALSERNKQVLRLLAAMCQDGMYSNRTGNTNAFIDSAIKLLSELENAT